MNTGFIAQRDTGRYYRLVAFAAAVALLLVAPDALAANGGGSMPWDGPLTQLRSAATGPWAYTFSLMGIIAAGAGLVFGADLNGFMKTIIVLVLVISVIVGANALMADMFGAGAEVAALQSTWTKAA